MKKALKEYLQPCLAHFLKSLTYKNGWLFGHYRVVIEINGFLDVNNLDEPCIGSEDVVNLFVFNCMPLACDLVWLSSEDKVKPSDWTAKSMKAVVLDNTVVSVDAIGQAFIQGKVNFYKRTFQGYELTDIASADWVSHPAGNFSKYLPMGYPLVFVKLWLSELASMLVKVGTVYTLEERKSLLLL